MSTTPGQAAYEAHRDYLGGNRPWDDVRPPERGLWETTAQAAITTHAVAITTAVAPDGDPWLERAAEILTEGQP